MSEIILKNIVANSESFASISISLDMISISKHFLALDRDGVPSELSNLTEDDDEKENLKDIFLIHQVHSLILVANGLKDMTAQLINEILGKNKLKITKCTLNNVKNKIKNKKFNKLKSLLTCFNSSDFKYINNLANTLKHHFIPRMNQSGYAVAGNKFTTGFQIDFYQSYTWRNDTEITSIVEAHYIIEIIEKFDRFKLEFDKVIEEINNLAT